MKKHLLLSLSFSAVLSVTTTAQIFIDTVSVGTQYLNQKWYSLSNDEVATQAKDNWDLAFETTGFTSAILANTQKADFAIYKAPYKITDYSTIDTSGISTWPVLQNSDTTWTVGAFNVGANLSNPSDLGWGVYDMNTHFVNGDSCYVIKLSATSYKKIKIVSLASGAYNFEYANIDGTNSQIVSLLKSNYIGKNFAYYDLSTNTAVDREPLSVNWDLTFVKYTSFVPPSGTPYGVTGVLHNKGVQVAQANDVVNPTTYTNFAGHSFKTAINEIGYDWKEINMTTFLWDIKMDTVYFVKDKPGNIWKVRFNKFSGSAAGNFIFSKEKLEATTVGIDSKGVSTSKVVMYPNPSNNENVSLLFSSEVSLANVLVLVTDISGKVISQEYINVESGLSIHPLPTSNISPGVYIVRIGTETFSSTQKLIIK